MKSDKGVQLFTYSPAGAFAAAGSKGFEGGGGVRREGVTSTGEMARG